MVVDLSAFKDGIVIPISGDISGLKTSIDGAEAELGGLSNSFKKYGNSMQSLGKQMSWKVTAPIVAIGTASVYTAAKFDDSMRKVQAKVGGTTKDLAAMREQALQLGADTAWSASEAADGMEYLAAAGFNAEQVMAAMPGMLALASSDAVDLGVAAEIAGATLNGFGLEAAEAGRVADVLAKSAAATNAGVTDMGEAMAYVAPVAKSIGLSLEETAAVIGILSNAGIKGSMAGTTLRGAISALLTPTSEAQKIMDRLGVSVKDSSGQMLPLNEIVGQFEKSGLSAADAMAIFGDRAGPGMLALIQQGQSGLVDMTAELENSAGAAQEMADGMESGIGGAFRQFEGSVESLSIAIGEALIPALLPLMDTLKGLVGWFGSLDKDTLTIIVTIAAFAAAVGPLLIVLGMLVSSIGSIITIIPVLMAGLTLLSANPIVLIIAGIVLAIIGLIALLKWLNDEFHWLDAVMAGAGAVMEWLQGIIQGVVDWFSSATEGVDVLGTALKVLMGPIGWVMIAMEMFGISWEDVWQGILDFAGFIWESLTAGITAIIGMWVDKFNYFKDILFAIWTAISGIFIDAWTNLTAGVTTMINFIVSIITSFRTVVLGIWTAIWTAISSVFVNAWTNLKIGVTTAIGFITGIFTSFRDTILGIWNTIWNGIKFVINSITGGINVMIRGLNNLRIDIPEWVPFMGGQTFGISIPEIPQLATGGIVTEPTIALIGEAGPEAVIPLESLSSQTMEINLAGIPKLATGGIVTEPTIAMIGEAGPEAVIPLNGTNTVGGSISINIENLSVRNDQDVKLIAQELATMIDRKNRGRGVTY